uniref:Autotransporter beta-domain-containing protein n=1 Tax=Candidatus Kentrum sp. TC TaxID=2126339 RepID=A0A450YFJ8_9GAMM|nr:MAG: Autotransporter beta-domain-containing protein [Candidatus Kentron sp. TC]
MNSTLERKVFKQGVKPSRRVLERSAFKKVLMSGVSAAVTAAMLGVSGQAMAVVSVTQNSTWNVAAGGSTSSATVAGDQALDMTGVFTLTINDDTADNLAIASISNTSGTGDIIVTPGAAANIAAIINGNVDHGGALKITATATNTATLTLKGATNSFGGGVVLNAEGAGVGKATLEFNNNSTQTFSGKIDGDVAGEGIIHLKGTGVVTFAEAIGSINSLHEIKFTTSAAGTNKAIFQKDVTVNAGGTGLVVGDGDFTLHTYTVEFDPSGAVLNVNARLKGAVNDTSNVIVKGGSGKTIIQNSTFTWGAGNSLNTVEIQDSGTQFISNATITSAAITLKSGTTSTFNNGGHVTGNLTMEAGSKIILGPAISKDVKVFGDGSSATNATTTAGTVEIHVSKTGLSPGDIIYLVDSNANITGIDPGTTFTITDDDPNVYFKEDLSEPTDFRLVAYEQTTPDTPTPPTPTSTSNPGLPTISGITHISDRMLNRAADAISSRTKFHRFAKYRQTGFRATDFYRSRQADERGFQRTDDRGFREADERGFQKTDDRRFREGDERGFQKSDDRRFREGDEREFQKANERKLREADEGKFDKDERERKLEEKLHEHGDGNLHKPDGRMIQKPADHPTGVSFGDSARVAENAWFETFGDWVEQDAARSSDNAYDVDGYDAEIYGLAFGVDTEVAKDTLLGVSFSYSNADVDWEGSSNAAGDVDHYQLTLYGEYRHDKFYLEGMLGYAMNDYEVSDLYGGAVRNSEFDSDQYLAKMELGVPIYMGNELFLTPKGELTWSHLDVDNYTQTGAVSTNLLVVNPNDWESATATLGAEIHQRIKKDKGYIIPWAYAGVSYDLTGEEASVRAALTSAPTNFYSLQGIDNEQFAGELEFGLEYEVGPWSVGAKYQGQFKSSRDTHSASLLAEYKF